MPRSSRQLAAAACIALMMPVSVFAQTSASPPSLASTQFRIAGRVVDAKTGNPLPRARVQITNVKSTPNPQTVISDDDGRFEFRTGAGKFSLEAARRGYITSAYDRHEQFSTAIVTGAGVDTENLILRISPVAALSGRVLDEYGEPVRNATVTVYRQDYASGASRIRSVRGTQTDDQGAYEATPLDEGTYFVAAKASPWYAVHPASEGGNSAAGRVQQSLDVAYPVTYYGDATEPEDATPIPIRGGDRLEADIHLTPTPALHVLFHVADDGTHGITIPVLQKPIFDEMDAVPNEGIQQVSPGAYEMIGVPAGRYVVRMPDGSGEFQAPTTVDLTTSQELPESSGNTTGKVNFFVQVDGAPGPPPQMQIGLRDNAGHVTWSGVMDRGQASFNDLTPGKYDVLAGSENEIYSVARMSSETGTIPGRSLVITPHSSLSVSVTLQGGTATVEGFAKKAGKPSAGAMIVLVPKNPESNRDLFRRDQSDLDGSFSLQNVSPGTYTVIAIEDGWTLDWAKPAVLDHYMRRGEKLVVAPKTTGTVQLKAPVEVAQK